MIPQSQQPYYDFPFPSVESIDLNAETFGFDAAARKIGESINRLLSEYKGILNTELKPDDIEAKQRLMEREEKCVQAFTRSVVALRAIPSDTSVSLLFQLLEHSTGNTAALITESIAYLMDALREYKQSGLEPVNDPSVIASKHAKIIKLIERWYDVEGEQHVRWLFDQIVQALYSDEDYTHWLNANPNWSKGVEP